MWRFLFREMAQQFHFCDDKWLFEVYIYLIWCSDIAEQIVLQRVHLGAEMGGRRTDDGVH